MRKTTYSEQEVAELDQFNKAQTRKGGVALIPVRDRGVAKLSNDVVVYWNHPARETEEVNGVSMVIKPRVPDNHFGIEVDGKMIVFNAEELMRYLRWA